MISTKNIEATTRTLIQNARLAIHDVLDAIVELVTNSDDRYQILGEGTRIEIDVERKRNAPSRLLIRDFADGMTARAMDEKLSRTGARVSGLEAGAAVRGTNSRGAKDVCALGAVTFESIAAEDGRFHKCEINPFFEFMLHPSEEVTPEIRERLGIPEGSGTLVTIEVDPKHSVPLHETLLERLAVLVPLRKVIADPRREVVLRDLNKGREDRIIAPNVSTTTVLKETFEIPGYREARAKLIVKRASKRFEDAPKNLRMGGILIESRRAVHEATLFDPGLERDQHAAWYCGRLVCDAIDDLCTEYDNCIEQHREPPSTNPMPLVDPSRRGGINRDHPFTKALFDEVLYRLRPLVEEERRRAESERAKIESQATRRRLNALEKAAAKFMQESSEDESWSEGDKLNDPNSSFTRKGFLLSPPFAKLIKGDSRRCILSVSQRAYPALRVGSTVQVSPRTADVSVDNQLVSLEKHADKDAVLQAVWNVKGETATKATGIRAEVDEIVATSMLEVLESRAQLYEDIDRLQFRRKRYRMKVDSTKRNLEVLAPLSLTPEPRMLTVWSLAVSCGDRVMAQLVADEQLPEQGTVGW